MLIGWGYLSMIEEEKNVGYSSLGRRLLGQR